MSASQANRTNIADVQISEVTRKVAGSEHVYSGTLVCVNASGYLVHAADTSGLIFDGYSETEGDNSGSAVDGNVSCKVTPAAGGCLGCIEVDAVSPDQSWIDQELAIADDHTVALLSQTSHVVRCGRCVDVTKTGTSGRVVIDTTDIVVSNYAGS